MTKIAADLNPACSQRQFICAAVAMAAVLVGGAGEAVAQRELVAWGRNGTGQCNVPAPNTDFVSFDGGAYHSLGLKSDGTIEGWGSNQDGQCDIPAPNADFVGVAAGWSHSLGLKAEGLIVAWGSNEHNQCQVPTPNAEFVTVAAGSYHSLGLKSDGSIVAWGSNTNAEGNYVGQCAVPLPNSDFVAITGGGFHSLGLKSDGTIVAWGANGQGQCNVPEPNTGFVAIAAGSYYSIGLKDNGTIVAWGANWDGQCTIPSPNAGFVAVACGSSHSMGLKSDGSVVAWGYNLTGQCDVPAPNADFVSIAAGKDHSLALKDYTAVTISGFIRDNRNQGMPNIVLRIYSENPRFTVTDSQGFYQALVPFDWQGSFSPYHLACEFTPLQRTYDLVEQDLYDQDYQGATTRPYTIDDIQVYEASGGAPAGAYLGLLVELEATVYVTPGTFSNGGGYILSQDGGINCYFEYPPPTLEIGDNIRINGYVWYDDNEEIYIGQPVCEVLGQLPVPKPYVLQIDQIVADYENIGSYLKTYGRVTEKGTLPAEGTDYIRLQYHGASIVICNDPDTGVSFDLVDVGESWSVQGPCAKRHEEIRVMPRYQSDLQQVDDLAWYIATDGDDDNPGTESFPFRTIQRGILAAYDGDHVMIADGTYSGDGNREIDFMGKRIVVRSRSGVRENCIIDAQGSPEEPRVGFRFGGGEDRNTRLESVTIKGGFPAGIECDGSFNDASLSPTLRDVVLIDNAGVGLYSRSGASYGNLPGFRIVSSVIRNNKGGGIKLDDQVGAVQIDSCAVIANGGVGLDLTVMYAGPQVSETTVEGNSGNGIVFWVASIGASLRIDGCKVINNDGWGITVGSMDSYTMIESTTVQGNHLGGLVAGHSISVQNSVLCDNHGLGIHAVNATLTNCDIHANAGGGASVVNGTFTDCKVQRNQGTGVRVVNADYWYYEATEFVSCLITDNLGDGVYINEYDISQSSLFESTTIARNAGAGVHYGQRWAPTGFVECIVAFNGASALAVPHTDYLAVTCSDLYGNAGGDFTGLLEEYVGINGNFSLEPRFCDLALGDYGLSSDSPCAMGNHPDGADCDQIGVLGVSCWPEIPNFTDIADGDLLQSTHTSGVALFDIDTDGDLDIFLANSWDEPNQCLLNDGAGAFTPVFDSVFDSETWNAAVAFAYANLDSLPDVILTGWNGVAQLLQNEGGGQFSDVTPPEMSELTESVVHGVSWFDLDGNRDPDLYLMVNHAPGLVLGNRGNFEFEEVGGGHQASDGSAVEVVPGDVDSDGDQDLYLVFFGADNRLLVNHGDGTFEDSTPPGIVGDRLGQSAAFVDFDNDRDLDLYLVNYGAANRMFLNDGTGAFTEYVDADLQNVSNGQSGVWGDYDLDGDLDIFITNSEGLNCLLRNDGASGFMNVTPDDMADPTLQSLGAAWGNVDGDGDLDLLVGNVGAPKRLWRNDLDNGNHWLQVRLRGVYCDRMALGAKVDCFSGDLVQRREIGSSKGMWSQDPAWVTFGLGQRTEIDSVVIRWPNGDRQLLVAQPIDTIVTVIQSYPVAVETEGGLPSVSALHPPYPNPFNAASTIRFDLAEPQRAEIVVYSIDGRRVRALLSQQLPAGRHAVQWNGTDDRGGVVASGTYFYRIEAGPYRATQKMVLAK